MFHGGCWWCWVWTNKPEDKLWLRLFSRESECFCQMEGNQKIPPHSIVSCGATSGVGVKSSILVYIWVLGWVISSKLLKTKGRCKMVPPVHRPAWHPWWGAAPGTRRSPRARSGPGSRGSDRSACPASGTATSPWWPWSSRSPPPPAWEEPRELRADNQNVRNGSVIKIQRSSPTLVCLTSGENGLSFVFCPFH